MIRHSLKITFLFILYFLAIGQSNAQQGISIELGNNDIGSNQSFTITLKVANERLKSYSNFPTIPGFVRRGTSSSSSTNIINGRVTSTNSVQQNYTPTKEGRFTLPSFSMEVNGKNVNSPGATITVGPPLQSRQGSYDPFDNDPFDEFFGSSRRQGPKEYVDVKADAFFAVTTDQSDVYVGEGFNVMVAFYVARDNQAQMDFYELNDQLTDIIQNIKPVNCWEENFDIRQIQKERITINGKTFDRYKLFQSSYFPLNTETITIPVFSLKMVKYNVAKNPSFFGQNRQQDFEVFKSKRQEIKVKELPPHPLKDVVAVGEYRLNERISSKKIETGKSFSLELSISGKGNISAIEKPQILESDDFEFYPPNVHQKIRKSGNSVMGSKTFDYYAIPKEPGVYSLADYFTWTYFNPKTEKYDTLKPDFTINVIGESTKNEEIMSNDMGTFYDRMDLESNELQNLNAIDYTKWLLNIAIILLSSFIILFILRKKS